MFEVHELGKLLRIAFRIHTVYIDTNSQEYEEAKGAKHTITLEVRPKTTEKVFWYASKTTEAEKNRLHTYDTITFSNGST